MNLKSKFYSLSIVISYLAIAFIFTTNSSTNHVNQSIDKESSLIAAVVHKGDDIAPK